MKLKKAQEQQNVLYEYVIGDSDTSVEDMNSLRKGSCPCGNSLAKGNAMAKGLAT